jgi:hypothetical protein
MKSTNPYIEVQYEDLVLVMRKTGLVPAVSSGQHQAASLLRVDPSHSATSLILSPVADRVDVLRRVGCHYLVPIPSAACSLGNLYGPQGDTSRKRRKNNERIDQ